MCSSCGAGECEVHAPGCKAYLSDPRVVGDLECSDCHGMVNNLIRGRCEVCSYWTSRREHK